jgi:hypothetical protein
LIADPKIFCGFPGDSRTYGDGRKKAVRINRPIKILLGPGRLALTGRRDLIYRLLILFFRLK